MNGEVENGNVQQIEGQTGIEAGQEDVGASREGKAEISRPGFEGSGEGSGKSEESQGSRESRSNESQTEEVIDPKLEEKRRKDREKKARLRAEKKAAAAGMVPMDVLPSTPGRKKKEETQTKKASNLTAGFIAQQIQGSHELLALFLGDEAKIDQAGAVMLGEAVYEVIQEYDLSFISKYGKWFSLITAAAIVEVPVIMRLRAKAAAAKAAPLVQQMTNDYQSTGPIAGIAAGTPQ